MSRIDSNLEADLDALHLIVSCVCSEHVPASYAECPGGERLERLQDNTTACLSATRMISMEGVTAGIWNKDHVSPMSNPLAQALHALERLSCRQRRATESLDRGECSSLCQTTKYSRFTINIGDSGEKDGFFFGRPSERVWVGCECDF